MENIVQNETLDLDVLESRLEMESVASVAASPVIPISHCQYNF
jgi:hypothetical protein